MISRRTFLGGASSIALIAASPKAAQSIPDIESQDQGIVVNAGNSSLAFINLAKQLGVPLSTTENFPTTLNSRGFPDGTLTKALLFGGRTDPYYYGRYLVWWSGRGSFQFNPPAIIYRGGTAVAGVHPSISGTVPNGNLAIGVGGAAQPTSSSPVEFAFGALVSAVGTSGGLIQFTTSSSISFGQGLPTGTWMKFNNLTYGGGAFPAGPNPGGSWTITNAGPNRFTLQNSIGLNAALISVVPIGGPGIQTECIISVPGITLMILPTTFSDFGDLVWCKKRDFNALLAGELASPDYVTAFKALRPRFVRFMDYSVVQGDRSSGAGPKGSDAYRTKATDMSWGVLNYQVKDYYTPSTSISNTGASGGFSDVYACMNPSASPKQGPYVEGEIIVGQLDRRGVNVGYTPALDANGRGVKPIFNNFGMMINVWLSGNVPAAGQKVALVFTGGGLPSVYTLRYTVQAGVLTLTDLWRRLATAINDDSTLRAVNIYATNPQGRGAQGGIYFNPNIAFSNGRVVPSLNAGMTVSGLDSSSSVTYIFGTINPGSLPNNNYVQFTYSTRLGGWIASVCGPSAGGVHGGPPLAFYAEICTRAKVGMYFTIGQFWSDACVYDAVLKFAKAGVKELVLELSNETWNFGLQEWNISLVQGCCLGFPPFAPAEMGFIGLRTIQIAKQAAAAWAAAGRSRSELFINICYQFVDMLPSGKTNSVRYKLNGSGLDAASGKNPALSAFGGYGSTPLSTDHSSFPNRPVDYADAIGGAPYWAGAQFNSGNGIATNMKTNASGTGIRLPLSAYNELLRAAYNHQYGTPAQRASALEFCYSGGPSGTGDLYDGTLIQATFTGSVSGTNLTVSGVTGAIVPGQYVNLPGIPVGTKIVAGRDPIWMLSKSGSSSDVPGNTYRLNNDCGLSVFSLGGTTNQAGHCGVGIVAASYDTQRQSLPPGQVGQARLGIIPYEGGWSMGPISPADSAQIAVTLATLGYNQGHSSMLVGATMSGPKGTSDTAELAATNIALLLAGFKQNERCRDLVTRYIKECAAAGQVQGSRVSLAAWYGWSGNSPTLSTYWSLYPASSVLSVPTQAWSAIQAFDGG